MNSGAYQILHDLKLPVYVRGLHNFVKPDFSEVMYIPNHTTSLRTFSYFSVPLKEYQKYNIVYFQYKKDFRS